MESQNELAVSVPENQSGSYLSSLVWEDHFLSPDDQSTGLLVDKERGGIGLNDPSEGLNVQDWTLRYYSSSGDFVIEAPNTAQTIIHSALLPVTEISLAFDQNMHPFIAYVEDGDAKYFWWNTATAQEEVTFLPANSLTPRCCIDDKRDFAAGAQVSDIILCWVNDGKLYKAIERERYDTHRIVKSPFNHPVSGRSAVLVRVGMNRKNRLQWLCSDPLINEVCQ